MNNQKIIAISAGQLSYKKEMNLVRKRIKYLNYGLLGLSTILHDKLNLDIVMFQADELLPEEFINKLIASGVDIGKCNYMLLSIPSFYSISWCKEFCRLIKSNYNITIIAGGRWVVDGNVKWLKSKVEYIDEYIEGFGERKLFERFGGNGSEIIDGNKQCFENFDYNLLFEYERYQPCIEISRGCGAGCAFCADRVNPRLPNKSVDKIISELNALEFLYPQYTFYMEAPHFIFEKQWTEKLCYNLFERDRIQKWRCTSRVESIPLDMLKSLSQAGLKVIDIGLESASSIQLRRMGKSINPKKYLEKAEQILDVCSQNNIWVKFNLLLYAGETYKTIEETEDWLYKHRAQIKDVSVSSLVYYRNMGNIEELIKEGVKIPSNHLLEEQGYLNLDLSDEISFSIAKEYLNSIPKLIANQRDFYDIKSIAYFPFNYTYNEFISDVKKCNICDLPFSVDEVLQ